MNQESQAPALAQLTSVLDLALGTAAVASTVHMVSANPQPSLNPEDTPIFGNMDLRRNRLILTTQGTLVSGLDPES